MISSSRQPTGGEFGNESFVQGLKGGWIFSGQERHAGIATVFESNGIFFVIFVHLSKYRIGSFKRSLDLAVQKFLIKCWFMRSLVTIVTFDLYDWES